MILAVTYENGQVFQHFGHTGQFKLFQVDGGAVTSSRVVDTNGSGDADQAVAALLAGQLSYDPDTVCSHHEHDHGHDCATHDCAQDHQGCPGNH